MALIHDFAGKEIVLHFGWIACWLMNTNDDFVLSQLVDSVEEEYFSMNQALNDRTYDILLTQAFENFGYEFITSSLV